MTIRKWVSPVLIAAFMTAVSPVSTFAAGADQPKAKDHAAGQLHAAIARAASDAAANPTLQLRATEPKSGARMQSTGGGGHTGMIIGLVTTVVGIAATVYTVKALQKSTKTIEQPNQ
jgi:hypothetical protein